MNPRPIAITVSCVVALTVLTACGPEPGQIPAPEFDPATEVARAAAEDFSSQLQQRLQGAMLEGGAVAAVEVCHADAPLIAEAVMAKHGVQLGRIAAPGRNRNPDQTADGWRLETLQAFQRAVDEGADAGQQLSMIRQDLPDGMALRMMRGIATEARCLACHGGTIDSDVQAAISARYPDDAATGFDIGQLRGALWVEVPSIASKPSIVQ